MTVETVDDDVGIATPAEARHLSKDADRQAFLRVLNSKRPERQAGGYARDDGTVAFFSRVNGLLTPDTVLLDFGAGRGRQFDVPDPGYIQVLQKFQGRVAKVIGMDVYDGVNEHPFLDERFVSSPNTRLPIPDRSVDIVVADWVLEHIDDPGFFAAEMERVIKPGGWLCARTVNRWGYVAIGARLVPNRLHQRVLGGLVPMGDAADVFETRYTLNSIGDLHRYFLPSRWINCSYVTNSLPRYFGKSAFLLAFFDFVQWLTPAPMRTDLFVFMRRKSER